MSIKPLTFPVKVLAAPLSSTGTRLILPDIEHWDGNDLTSAEVGTVMYVALMDTNKTKMELIEVDPSTLTVATTTGVLINKRGLSYMGGIVAAAETQYEWTANETLVMLGSNPPQLWENTCDLDEAQTFTAIKTFTTAYRPKLSADGDATANEQLVTKGELSRTALGTTTNESVITAGTAGETVAAGNIVYLKAADGYWWKADASSAATAEGVELAVAQGAGTAGNSITGGVLKSGRDQKNTGLTDGQKQYLSDTAGGISTSAGTVEVTLGYGLPDGTFMFTWGYDQRITEDLQDALGGTSGTPSSTNKFVTDDDTEVDGVDQSQTTANASAPVGEANTTGYVNKRAQSFVAAKSGIYGVKMYKQADTGSFTGTVTVALYADSGGSPTGAALATVTIDNATYLALSVGEFTATFAATYATVVGTTYWIVVSCSTADTSNHPNLGSNSAGGYASGSTKYWNTTDGWTATATIDLYFKTLLFSKVVRAKTNGKLDEAVCQITDANVATLTSGSTSNASSLHNHLPAIIQGTRDITAGDGAVNYAHSLGRTPKWIEIHAMFRNASQLVAGREADAISHGASDGTNHKCTYFASDKPSAMDYPCGNDATVCVYIHCSSDGEAATRYQEQKATAAFDGTNITLTWNNTAGASTADVTGNINFTIIAH